MGTTQNFALVTGAAGAIGSAVTVELSKAGIQVLAVDKVPMPSHAGVETLKVDISHVAEGPESPINALSLWVREKLGDGLLVGLINNAAHQVTAHHSEITSSDWLTTMSTNLIAPALLTSEFRGLLTKSQGAVVNVGSVHGTSTKPGFAAYAASKSALVSLTRSIAIDEGAALRIFCLSPGAVDTPMLRAGFSDESKLRELAAYQNLGNLARPEEIASLIVDLVVDGHPLLSGSNLSADGGTGARLHDPV